jgi:hypothetical protein
MKKKEQFDAQNIDTHTHNTRRETTGDAGTETHMRARERRRRRRRRKGSFKNESKKSGYL